MEKKIIIALGGNALQSGNDVTAEAQHHVVEKTCQYVADICQMGYQVGIVHGNGPQVGRILLASEFAKSVTPAMPFDVCGAMSQGYIGYHIQQCLGKILEKRGVNLPVVTLLTQVLVDKNDKGFVHPTKPIGPFYTEEEAKQIQEEKGYSMKEDAGRGWRRVVASPDPKAIVELETAKKIWNDAIIVTCGGGGIPVIENEEGELEGVAAVIDKDFAAALLAQNVEADVLMILTEVEKVSINFNKPNQEDLGELTLEQANKYIEEGHFAPGSMLPKVQAAMRFVEKYPEKKAIITSLYKAKEALNGETGTVIVSK